MATLRDLTFNKGGLLVSDIEKRMQAIIGDGEETSTRQSKHVAIVLDKSGSMQFTKGATISGFNEQVQAIRAEADAGDFDVYVSLFLFGTTVDEVFFNVDAYNLEELTDETYRPNGTTAMLDAVGTMITRLINETDNDQYLLIVMSDGCENASQDYTYEHIAELIQERQDTGMWTVTYMGANQDLSVLSERLNIHAGNTASYDATNVGTRSAYATMSTAIAAWLCDADSISTANFYASDDDEDTD